MKITLVTACYNRSRTIGNTIESVLAQDYPRVEYIVVDGASADGSLNIIRQYESRIDRIISEPDGGMYEAINKGIRAATGDIVGLLHSDDEFYSSGTLSKIADAFALSGADIVYGNGIFIAADNSGKIVRDWISGQYKRKNVKRGWLPLHPTVYAKREVFGACGLYDESYKIAADSDMLVRMFYERDFRIHYMNDYVVRMSMGGVSTGLSTQVKKWKEDLRMYRSHGFNPYTALAGKILSKIPQFL